MVNLFFYTFASYGLCYILMEGKILNYFREQLFKIKFFKNLLNCSLCTGFWTGLFIGILTEYNPLLFAFYSSATCYFLYLINYILLDKVYSTPKD